MSGLQPGDLDDPHLRSFTIDVATALGGLVALWLGPGFVIVMGILAIWHLVRYVAPRRRQ